MTAPTWPFPTCRHVPDLMRDYPDIDPAEIFDLGMHSTDLMAAGADPGNLSPADNADMVLLSVLWEGAH